MPDDPMVVPRAMITDASGALLGFWDVMELWIARRFEGANTAYFEAATIGDSIQLIRAAVDPGCVSNWIDRSEFWKSLRIWLL